MVGCTWQPPCLGLRFRDPEMEAAYYEQRMAEVGQISKVWCAVHVLLCAAWFLLTELKYKTFWRPSLQAFLPEPIPFLAIGVVYGSTLVAPWRRYVHILMYLSSLVIVGFFMWKAHFHVTQEMAIARSSSLNLVFAALQGNADALKQLRTFVNQEETRKVFIFSEIQMLMQFNILQFLGLDLGTSVVYLSLPIAMVVTAFASPVVADPVAEVLAVSTLVSLLALLSGVQASRLQRQRFATDHALQQSLEREAQTSQRLADQERGAREAAVKADNILNHILKNLMADAAGCIYLFSDGVKEPIPPDLQQALGLLDRGMRWCRRRQALLRITAGTYCTAREAVHLPTFGKHLVNGRPLACHFVDDVVLLDPLLCDILLDNAISNALRHGDTSKEPVAFSMALRALTECDAELTFAVRNRVPGNKPPITLEFVEAVLRGEVASEPGNGLSDGLGLQHLFLAAEVHAIRLTLGQEGDVVVLRATLTVQRESGIAHAASTHFAELTMQGLRILCLDDSDIARRLLENVLWRHLPSCTVEVFGSDPQDVHSFVEAALDHADVVLVDNHLLYEGAQFLGTQLLVELFQNGYRGFACMRSANISPEDQAQYVASGAHCCMGKDVRPQELVSHLQASYLDYCHASQFCAAAPASTLSLAVSTEVSQQIPGDDSSEASSQPRLHPLAPGASCPPDIGL
eukprot:EG_transcript_3253